MNSNCLVSGYGRIPPISCLVANSPVNGWKRRQKAGQQDVQLKTKGLGKEQGDGETQIPGDLGPYQGAPT